MTADQITIRPATERDAEAVGRMAAEFQQYIDGLEDDPRESTSAKLTAEVFLRHGFGERPWFFGLIAELNGEPMGYLLYHFGYWPDDALPTLHVADLFVREAARGQGIGASLMDEATRILSAHGGKMLLWTVWDRNKAAIAFYEGFGAEFFAEERLMRWTADRWPELARD